MTESRDSTQQILDLTLRKPRAPLSDVVAALNNDAHDLGEHVDRLYERYHDLWDWCEKLSECVAAPPPLPLKYK